MSDSSSQPLSAAYFIKYNPSLNKHFGSQNATILFDRLEYWFSKKKTQFYKFIEPCNHPLCKEGDTWAEELGFTRKIFFTAFSKIGTRYKSKTEFEKESDPFKGKFFAYYQDRQSKKTIFVRNDKLLSEFYGKLKNLLSEKTRGGDQPRVDSKKGRPTDSPLVHPHVGATKDKQRDTSSKKETGILISDVEPDTKLSESSSKSVLDMKTIWVDVVGNRGLISFTPEIMEKALKAFEGSFQGSLATWRAHCLKIASSKFLMGEKDNTSFEIKFLYAISSKFVNELNEGKYELNTRENKEGEMTAEIKKKTKIIRNFIDFNNDKTKALESEKTFRIKRLENKKRKDLGASEIDIYRKDFEKELMNSNDDIALEFQKIGWESRLAELLFDTFLGKKIRLSEQERNEAISDLEENQKQLMEKNKQLESLLDMGCQLIKDIENGVVTSLVKNMDGFSNELRLIGEE